MAEFEDKLSAILGNEAAMGQIMALAKSFSGEEANPSAQATQPDEGDWVPVVEAPPSNQEDSPLNLLGDVDPRLIQMGMRLLGEYQGGSSNSLALLTALRPYIRPERYQKLDRAIQLARLSRIIRVAFGALGEGAEDV